MRQSTAQAPWHEIACNKIDLVRNKPGYVSRRQAFLPAGIPASLCCSPVLEQLFMTLGGRPQSLSFAQNTIQP
jgi:hypothetical protein